ncbi:MAG: outer membrane beta-barrel protein [Sphingobacteriaceae bacterium]
MEDVLKKLPGVDVDKDGNVTAQGKQVTKIRVNGKDFFAGDVKTATQNLPADVVENIQIIDDYGDQSNLTGVKTGEPDKIMNIVIRKDKNNGYFGQATAGGGNDAIPRDKDKRYLGIVNANIFHDKQQISLLSNLNNTNVNTFAFSGGGNQGGGGRGGRGGGSSQTTPTNGLTAARSVGLNYRDEWGKKVSIYGSYSFADLLTNTASTTLQQNISSQNPGSNSQFSNTSSENENHRFNFNLEYKPDTINYIKVSPSFSYNNTATDQAERFNYVQRLGNTVGTSNNINNSLSPNYGANILFNHKFTKKGRNISLSANLNTSTANQDQTSNYEYTELLGKASPTQIITSDNSNNNFGTNLSYMEPVSKFSFLEFNYAFNKSTTRNNRQTDTLTTDNNYIYSDLLSNNYNYTFTTNRFGLNYRFVEQKYNYTLGMAVQPAVLDGQSINRNVNVKNSTFNYIPTARFVYNFSRSHSLSVNYSGSSSQPSYTQLQPISDISNPQFPVEGNPALKPEFNTTLFLRYNKFSFETGNILFTNLSFNTTQDKVVNNTLYLRARPTGRDSIYAANSTLTRFQNTNGFYAVRGFYNYSKPFDERKYTLSFNGNVNYNNNIGFIDSEKNIGKNWVFSQGVRFRVSLTELMDTEINTNYTVNSTVNSIASQSLINTNAQTWNVGLNGKNYLWTNWTLGYDFTKAFNNGFSSTIKSNPKILNVYLERRFLKKNMATIRVSGLDLFNENTGLARNVSANAITDTRTNRLSRYFLLSFTMRIQKFAGKVGGSENIERSGGDGRGYNRRDN